MVKSILVGLVMMAVALPAATNPAPRDFGSPEEARDALLKAAADGPDAVVALFGPESAGIIHSGDAVLDKKLIEKFNERASEKIQVALDETNSNRAELLIGQEEWPFPIPLYRKNGRWSFDVQEGKAEIRYRIIGGDELDAIEVCRGYVEAQELYSQTDWEGRGVLQYAARIQSSPGKKDGLYWPGDESPLSEGVTKAFNEGYTKTSAARQAYHGYYYKILYAQGPAAQSGAQEYVVHDLMIGGFALVAWPAEYGVSGIRTFIVNQDGIVYEKDLGPTTSTLAKSMKVFNPDSSWQPVP